MTNLHFDDCLTADEWWREFHANACCPSRRVAAARLCGCGGSGELPAGISRLLINETEDN